MLLVGRTREPKNGQMVFACANQTGAMFHEQAWCDLLRCRSVLEIIPYIFPYGCLCVGAGGDHAGPLATGNDHEIRCPQAGDVCGVGPLVPVS